MRPPIAATTAPTPPPAPEPYARTREELAAMRASRERAGEQRRRLGILLVDGGQIGCDGQHRVKPEERARGRGRTDEVDSRARHELLGRVQRVLQGGVGGVHGGRCEQSGKETKPVVGVFAVTALNDNRAT